MIYCSKCGTANRDGSKFCNECGERLPGTGVLCPACRTPNPVTSLFCQNCGARLVEVSPLPEEEEEAGFAPVTGISLPSRPLTEAPSEVLPEGQAEGALPRWLREPETGGEKVAEEEKTIPEEPRPSEPEEAVAPDWLTQLRAGVAEEGPAVEEPPVSEREELGEAEEAVPEWLRRLRESLPGLEEAEEETPPPAWLEGEETFPKVPVFTGSVEGLGEAETAPEEAEEEPVEAWAGPGPAVPEEVVPLKPGEEAPFEIPPWLEGLEPTGMGVEEAEPSEVERTAMPSWMEELAAPEAEEAPQGPPTAQEALPTEEIPAGVEEVPEWLLGVGGIEEGEAEAVWPAKPGAEEIAAEGAALPAEIPDWLEPLQPEAEVMVEGEEGSGVLAGISGVVPAEQAAVALVGEAERVEVAPPVGEAEASLFREILQEAPAAEPSARPRERGWPLWARWLISLLLLTAVGVPIVWRSVMGKPLLDLHPAVAPEVLALYEQVQAVGPGDAVLVGWDFDPSSEGELGPLAEVMVGHLMQRGARVFVVSQLPAGAPLAQQVLEGLAATQGTYAYGSHYLNLGYLPGDELGLRALSGPGGLAVVAADFAEGKALTVWDVVQGVVGVDDFRLIVELTDDPTRVRRWIEQVGAQHEVPLVAAVSAVALPAVYPYYQTEPRQLAGLAGGVPGAAAYESLREVYSRGQGSLEALAGGVLALVLIVLAGNVAAALGWSRR